MYTFKELQTIIENLESMDEVREFEILHLDYNITYTTSSYFDWHLIRFKLREKMLEFM